MIAREEVLVKVQSVRCVEVCTGQRLYRLGSKFKVKFLKNSFSSGVRPLYSKSGVLRTNRMVSAVTDSTY